jgi:serine/threonine protein kinase
LDKLSLTTVKRACIRNWLEEHGGNYFSLKILPNHNWIKLIDSGSFSSAHLVKSDKDEMQVVKITKDNNTKSAVREIKLLTSIDHPHIVKLYDHSHINGSFWSLIEYCNMSSVSNMGLPLPIEKRLICLSHVINGLEYLHSLGIAHRDIKSDNIFVHIENDLTMFKLGDFNLARNISDNDDSITPLSFCGSYYTMAPEILNKQTYDVRCDMWSYLCLLIEISDGRHNNPLCISTENLINSTSELHSIELQIIRMLHYIDPELRKNALEIKIILDDLIKSSEINNSNTARRCRSQSL